MCANGETATAMVLTETGQLVPVSVDRCLADLITALNLAGIATVSSCCGHGDGNSFYIGIAPEACFFGWRGDCLRRDAWCGLVKRRSAVHAAESPVAASRLACIIHEGT